MRHLFHHQGLQFHCDSEVPFTHVVIGQRDESADEKKLPERKGKTHADFTPEQYAAIAKFTFEATHGWYAIHLLAWSESDQAAKDYKARFEAEGRINVSIHSIDPQHVIQYA